LDIFKATGRRKCAIAQVKMISGGTGQMTINRQKGTDYLQSNPTSLLIIYAPIVALGMEDSYDISVQSSGGGLNGQAEAIQLGIAKSLCQMQPTNRETLKAHGYLTRNSLCKERKKYGLKKARKASQFSKR
jgi:small subunit ribosomal protein S9